LDKAKSLDGTKAFTSIAVMSGIAVVSSLRSRHVAEG
jgi:hypothetical protein